MKSNFILSIVLASAALVTVSAFGHKELFIKEPLNTHGNNVGIKEGEVCDIIYNPQASSHNTCMVVCEGPGDQNKIFKNIGKIIGSATGTPGWDEYSNYIGSKAMDTGKVSAIGGIKRIIICDGPCEKKEESEEHHKMRIMPVEMPS